MSLRNARPEPCWQVNDARIGEPPEAADCEGWPHYSSEAAALVDLDERLQEWLRDNPDEPVTEVPQLVAVESFDRPCVVLVCDVCGEKWEDADIGWSHHDPAGLDLDLADHDWVELVDGRHRCDKCDPGPCECGEADCLTCSEGPVLAPVVPCRDQIPLWGGEQS